MKKVYIIDDDRNIVESLTMVLNAEGYETKSQHDENGIISNVSDFNADLVILDVMFPEDDGAGFKMARVLKADETTKNIPILMLSAINEKGDYAGTFSNRDIDEEYLPVNDFVEKPINPAILIEKVKKLIK